MRVGWAWPGSSTSFAVGRASPGPPVSLQALATAAPVDAHTGHARFPLHNLCRPINQQGPYRFLCTYGARSFSILDATTGEMGWQGYGQRGCCISGKMSQPCMAGVGHVGLAPRHREHHWSDGLEARSACIHTTTGDTWLGPER